MNDILHSDIEVHCDGIIVEEKIRTNLVNFVNNKRSEGYIVYKGVTDKRDSERFMSLLSEVGMKGNYFKKKNSNKEELEICYAQKEKFIGVELASHTRNPSKDSKYISTSLEYKIAEDYAKAYSSRKKESPFILMIYIDKDKDNGLFEKLTPSSTNFNEDKEVTFMHAIFVDRIIGFFSLDADNNFYIFNLNPFWLHH